MDEYSVYPFRVMNISAAYNSPGCHATHLWGRPCDFPIDEAGLDKERDWFYAPFTCQVKRVYGVGHKGANTLWFESIQPVITPMGKIFITINCRREDDEDLYKLKPGTIFKQGQPMFREGNSGSNTDQSFGNYVHFSAAKGKFVYPGWVLNSKGAWVTTGIAIKPEQAFFLDVLTVVKNNKGLNFIKKPE